MPEIPRLNGVVKQLAAGKPVFLPFMTPSPENAMSIASTNYDGVVWEMEHSIYDIRNLRCRCRRRSFCTTRHWR